MNRKRDNNNEEILEEKMNENMKMKDYMKKEFLKKMKFN